ncbi:MAG: class I SAM-dependent methyltransferase [Hyphomicrobiales bacterium]|nr:class I SAM-dependent methyltransferase [Hyphomicrobiales bacterium]
MGISDLLFRKNPIIENRNSGAHMTLTATSVQDGVEGWCTPHKAQKLYELAALPETKLAVEIGIFGGKSLLPMAAAFANKGAGVIYGVEPWDNAVAVETVTNAENDKWWSEHDLVAIKRGFFTKVTEFGLEKHVRVLEIPSDVAVSVFQSPRFHGKIDLVHIDGAHSLEQSVFDVAYWLRLCRSGGHIVLDDIHWASVRAAYDYLKASAKLIYESNTDANGHFAIFSKH